MRVLENTIMTMEDVVAVLLKEYEKNITNETDTYDNILEEYIWYDVNSLK